MKKRILLLLVTLVLLTLTACGKKGESGSSDEKNAEIKGKILNITKKTIFHCLLKFYSYKTVIH